MGPPRSGGGRGPPPEVVVEEDPPGSGSGRGPLPTEVVVEEDPLEVVVEEDPQKWWWKRTPLRSGGGRGPPSPTEVVVEEDPQGKDQTRPAENYCWASGWYALEKRLPCLVIYFYLFILLLLAHKSVSKF